MTADLSDPAAADRLIADTLSAFGRIDILVNNAGLIRRQPAATHTDEDWDLVIEREPVDACSACARGAGAHMLERGQGGKIVNIASLLSFQGGITVPGVRRREGRRRAADQGARQRVGRRAASTSTRSRPATWKPTTRPRCAPTPTRNRQIIERIPAGRWGVPADLAGAVIFLASRASDYVHGHVLTVDGGWMGR